MSYPMVGELSVGGICPGEYVQGGNASPPVPTYMYLHYIVPFIN